MQQIENYLIIPTGRSQDLTNQIFGDYKVIYRTCPVENSKSKQAYWLCQCLKCNQYRVKTAYMLKNGVNECDCKYDLTDKKFGRWTVQYLCDERTKNRGKIWHCKCDCGNEKDVPAEILIRGDSQSCGCIKKEQLQLSAQNQRIDLTGQRFGKLVALYPIYSGSKFIHTKWHCKCDCGNECDIDMGNLRQGFSKSCGCTQSLNEERIIKILTNANIPFKYQHRFIDLENLKFDFWINEKYVLEFDGIQHFQCNNSGWDTQDHLIRTHKNDLLKNQYCFKNNIPIIRIPYNIEYLQEDLILETSKFLLTKENENNYYIKNGYQENIS